MGHKERFNARARASSRPKKRAKLSHKNEENDTNTDIHVPKLPGLWVNDVFLDVYKISFTYAVNTTLLSFKGHYIHNMLSPNLTPRPPCKLFYSTSSPH